MTHLSQFVSNGFRDSFLEEYFCFAGRRTGFLWIVGVVWERRRDAESGSVERGLGMVISVKPISKSVSVTRSRRE